MNVSPQFDLQTARHQMLAQQLRCADVTDSRILQVLAEVPRERFVPKQFRNIAFADTEVPLAAGQRMLTPTLEGRILKALDPKPQDRVLEIGTGSGYFATCLARLAAQVTSIDIFPQLTDAARERLDEQRIVNCELESGDIFTMEPGEFDVIAVTGSLPVADPRFEQWLRPGGRLFVIVGDATLMDAMLISRLDQSHWQRHRLFETVVPPLINAPRPAAFRF